MKKVNDIDANIQYQQIFDSPLTQDGGQNPNGQNLNGQNQNGYDPNGYNPNGYNPNGYNPNGYNPNGYNPNGFNPNGYNTNGYDPNELQKLIKNIDIPDKVDFRHVFQLEKPYCCDLCGKYLQSSSFFIQGIGELAYEINIKKECGCDCLVFDCCVCYKRCTCLNHYFPVEIYKMSNDKVSMEFWHEGLGKIQIDNKPILDFYQCYPNQYECCLGSCCSTYPELKITSQYDKNKTLFLKQQRNMCAETVCSGALCFALLDAFNLKKNYFVEGLTQGKCQIVNTRSCFEAVSKTTACQTHCGCPFTDYPQFSIQFENVLQLDKIAIILGLVHISYYKEWVVQGTSFKKLKTGSIYL